MTGSMELRRRRAPERASTEKTPGSVTVKLLPSGVVGRLRVAFRYTSGFFRSRDRRTWIFGNHKGYRDSPRYLAEYIVTHRPQIDAWWLARTADEADAARRAGLRAALIGSAAGNAVCDRAGVAFLCNGFLDVDIGRLGGAHLVHLYHGTALKLIGLDEDGALSVHQSLRASVAWRFRRILVRLSYSRIGLFVAAGDLARTRFRSAFGAPASRIQVLGTPRFDVIQGDSSFQRLGCGNLRERLGLDAGDRAVLWLPTWRESGDADWLPEMKPEIIETTIGRSSVVLLIKPHPYSDQLVFGQRLPSHPRVRLLAEDAIDVNCLLHIAEALVTDYSSAALDYAILGRPIYFFTPDIDAYVDRRGLYDSIDRLTGDSPYTDYGSLLEELAAPSWEAGLAATDRLRKLSGNIETPGSCQRIVDAVARNARLDLRPT